MSNKDYIENLIKKTIACPSGMNDNDIQNLYNDIQEVFRSNKYSNEEKECLHKNAKIEAETIICKKYKIIPEKIANGDDTCKYHENPKR